MTCFGSRLVSQNWITSHTLHSIPHEEEIADYFDALSFADLSAEGVPAFYSRDLDLLVLDAQPHNILLDEQENLVPIDLVIGVPSNNTRAWLRIPG